MNAESFRDYCLALPHCTELLPFDEVTLCFKINHTKIFAILPLDTPTKVNLKCDPIKAVELRECFNAVEPGFHMNKKHWNTVSFNDDLSDETLIELIDHSYELVWNSLPNKMKSSL